MRLIEYGKIREQFNAKYKETRKMIIDGETHLDNLAEGFTEADEIIRKLPDIDAVPVVRCGECKHWQRNFGVVDSPNGHCFYLDFEMNGHDFCSYGERKDGAE